MVVSQNTFSLSRHGIVLHEHRCLMSRHWLYTTWARGSSMVLCHVNMDPWGSWARWSHATLTWTFVNVWGRGQNATSTWILWCLGTQSWRMAYWGWDDHWTWVQDYDTSILRANLWEYMDRQRGFSFAARHGLADMTRHRNMSTGFFFCCWAWACRYDKTQKHEHRVFLLLLGMGLQIWQDTETWAQGFSFVVGHGLADMTSHRNMSTGFFFRC